MRPVITIFDATQDYSNGLRLSCVSLATRTAARSVVTGERGTLHVGYAPSPSVDLLPRAMDSFRHSHPEMRVTLHDETSPHMLAGLRTRQFHVALMMQPPRQSASGIELVPLRSFPVVVATSDRHPLAHRRSLQLGDITREPIVVLSRNEYPDYHAMLRRIVGRNYDRMNMVEECDTGMSLIAAVEANRGVAFTIATLRASAGRRLRFIPLGPKSPQTTMGVAYPAGEPPPATRAFLAALQAAATSLARAPAASQPR